MSRIKPLELNEAPEEAKEVYAEIEGAFGMVPNLFKTYAHFPALLKANWEKTKSLLMGGQLPRELKECIALVVSEANGCRYCVAAHSMMLKHLGFDDARVEAVTQRLQDAGLPEKERRLLEIARAGSLNPFQLTDGDFEELRRLGWSDAEIVEALGVMELFTAYNKFLDSLAVEIDF